MGTSVVLRVVTGGVLGAVVSCGGLVRPERCDGVASGGEANGASCDPSAEPAPDPGPGDLGPYAPGGGFDPCSGTKTYSGVPGLQCGATGPGTHAPGDACNEPTDCRSVCCESDGAGGFLHVYRGPYDVDASIDDASSDASTGDPDASDADGGPSSDASTRFPAIQRIWACECGFCPTPEEACALASPNHGLGGP